MKNKTSRKAKRFFAVILATALVFGMIMSMPLVVGAAHLIPGTDFGPVESNVPSISGGLTTGDLEIIAIRTRIGSFMVTHPVGGLYALNATATPLRAKFEYDAEVDTPLVVPTEDITVQWYWSYTNDNTNRFNPLGTATKIPYTDKIAYTTTYTPPTTTVGVKYYYAVLIYYDYLGGGEFNHRKMEAVTNPARIEVTYSFEVKKTDEDGQPLAGAVLLLTPQDGKDAQDVAARTYEATSGADGIAKFTAREGLYLLSEKKAPDGYEGTDTEYSISVTEDDVYQNISGNIVSLLSNTTITIVNKPIATATPTPTPTPVPASTPTPAPGNMSFEVRKTDGDGTLLSGALISLVPDTSYTQGASVITREVSTVNGIAKFDVAPGYYILSEKQAPAGYNATNDKYYIQVSGDGVKIIDPETKNASPYATVTFVNKEIPRLDDVNHFAFMQGYPEGDFRPDNNMSRAEAVVMFSRLLSNKMDLEEDFRMPYYPDADLTDWYANQVCYMYELGVLTDYSRDTRFRPDDPVTRAEFATLAAHFEDLDLIDTNKFSDVPNSHWAIKYINSAEAKGWITGYPDGTFKPEGLITRAEVVTLVGRMIDRYADEDYVDANLASLPRNYWDLKKDDWAYYRIMEASIGHEYTKGTSGERWTSTYK